MSVCRKKAKVRIEELDFLEYSVEAAVCAERD
jgi:hypothetical protein